MENIETNGEMKNVETGIPEQPKKNATLDTKQAYIDINKEGWITATVHLSKGLYEIIGFLAQVQDVARVQIAQAMKRAKEQDEKLIKPGFRGFKGLFTQK